MNNLPVPTHKTSSPNPQGKGLRTVLDALNEFKRNSHAQPKHINQISAELFTSLLILESQIRFKPVLEQPYWLYLKNGAYHLSLIHPQQWSQALAGIFIGECQLHTDLTWSLVLSDEAVNNAAIMDALNQRRAQFDEQLIAADKLQTTLPVYISSFSFYSRILASGLAYSLGSSMQQTCIAQLSYAEALQQYPSIGAQGNLT